MTKYIEADKAEIILEHILETDTRTFFNRGNELTDKVYSFVAKGLETLKSLPAADVAKVKHGHWKHLALEPYDITGHTYGECSICGKRRIVDNYCPNCGALMENEDVCL